MTDKIRTCPLGREIRTFRRGDYRFEFIRHDGSATRPLVLLQALEYPGWPDEAFCALGEAAGLKVFSVRRPGFSTLPPMADIDQQVTMLGAFLEQEVGENAVIVSSGTANALGYRLARHPNVGLTVLGNCCFNYDPTVEIRPDWFARHMEQTLSSVTGARLALMGLKGAKGLFGKYWVTENFMQKSPGDLDYLNRNRELFGDAMDANTDGLDIHTFLMELRSTLKEDSFLQDGCFEGVRIAAVSGVETSRRWQTAIEAEAARVGAPLHYFTSGDALVVYQSASQLMDLIRRYS